MMGSDGCIIFSRDFGCASCNAIHTWGIEYWNRLSWYHRGLNNCFGRVNWAHTSMSYPKNKDLSAYAEMPGTYAPWVEDVEEVRP